jgi:hypothetical protein
LFLIFHVVFQPCQALFDVFEFAYFDGVAEDVPADLAPQSLVLRIEQGAQFACGPFCEVFDRFKRFWRSVSSVWVCVGVVIVIPFG